jgi:uncharacterized protein
MAPLPSESLVRRYDRARLSQTSRTPQGFLKAPAFFTRTGVFEYARADGTKVRELRPESEVFAKESLATLAGAPLTKDHPIDGMVTPDNAKTLAVGWTGETIERKDALVSGIVTIMDGAVIKDAEAGKLHDISMGYTCRIDATPGTDPTHGRYDQVQRDIRYNHVALGGADWGRAGGEVGLRLDSTSAIAVDTIDVAEVQGDLFRKDHKDRSSKMEKLIIAGIEFEVPAQAAQAFRAEQTRHDAETKKITGEKDALQGRFDAQAQELATVKAKLTEAEKPERFDAAVADRIDLLAKAKKVMGDVEIKGTKREIMELVLKKDAKDADFSGKSDDYVQARFDALAETVDTSAGAQAAAREAALKAAQGGTRQDAKTARERMLERNAKAWQEKA